MTARQEHTNMCSAYYCLLTSHEANIVLFWHIASMIVIQVFVTENKSFLSSECRCGLQRQSMMNPGRQLFTGNAFSHAKREVGKEFTGYILCYREALLIKWLQTSLFSFFFFISFPFFIHVCFCVFLLLLLGH